MSDTDNGMNPPHFGSDLVDIHTDLDHSQNSLHFWLRLDTLAEVTLPRCYQIIIIILIII